MKVSALDVELAISSAPVDALRTWEGTMKQTWITVRAVEFVLPCVL